MGLILLLSLLFNFVLLGFFGYGFLLVYRTGKKSISKLCLRTSSIYYMNRKILKEKDLRNDLLENPTF